ncbi:hypothetical protein BD413DRAFT_478024 [Trametes elegans]|nr:hypothetical protein BD413DRAFT_478024 [Trametes elegans]
MKCEYCGLAQTSGRYEEFVRHVKAHFRVKWELENGPMWQCCGVPVEEAYAKWDQATWAKLKPESKQERVINGRRMVGGCGETCARKSVLAKHIRKSRGKCVGDADAPYILGNTAEGHSKAR